MKSWLKGAIDCDIHPKAPTSKELLEYLDPYWRDVVSIRGIDGLDLVAYPPNAPASRRTDWASGGAGPRLEDVQRDVLDAHDLKYGICNVLHGAMGLFNPDLALAFCRAVNDWLRVNWLDADSRLRGSILVPLQDVKLAVEEIDRVAQYPRFVQVLLLMQNDTPLGRRHLWPVYAAAERHGLPVAIHAGSLYRTAPTGAGWPTYYVEDYIAHAGAARAQLVSMLVEGVFASFPKLNIVMAETGFNWLPAFNWQIDKLWKALRMEIPWVAVPPSEIVAKHVRFTLQPIDKADDSLLGQKIYAHADFSDMILYSSDYPHWHFDDMPELPIGMPPAAIAKMHSENAFKVYARLIQESR